MRKTLQYIAGFLLALMLLLSQAGMAQNNYFITKTASPNTVQSGQTFTYTIQYSTATAVSNLTITDNLPAGFVISTASKPYTTSGSTITFSLGSYGGGASSITITGYFPCPGTCNGAQFTNTATMSALSQPTISDTALVTVTASNPWKIAKIPMTTKIGPNYYGLLGGVVRYKLIVYKQAPWNYFGCTGQMQLNTPTITDNLPAGAQMMGMYDAGLNPFPNLSGSVSNVGSNYTLTLTNPFNPSAISYWYDAVNGVGYYQAGTYYIDIKYPCGAFATNQTVNNTAILNGNLPCNVPFSSPSNATSVILTNPSPGGVLAKTNFIHSNPALKVPGCGSYYTIGLTNNGNIPMSNISVSDTFPPQINVTSMTVVGSAASPITLQYAVKCGMTVTWYNYLANPITSTTPITVGSVNMPVTAGCYLYAIKMNSPGLPLAAGISSTINYTILNPDQNGNAVPAGTVVQNCARASFKGNLNAIDMTNCTLDTTQYNGTFQASSCDTFHIRTAVPNLNLDKRVCTIKSCYKPGDTVRYHLWIKNIGSGALTAGAVLTDVLPSSLSFINGSATIYSNPNASYGCGTGTALPGFTAMHNTAGPVDTLKWTLPAGLPGSCSSSNTNWYIDFSAVVNSNAAAGVASNLFTVHGANTGYTASSPKYSNSIPITICTLDSMVVEKLVSKDNGATWSTSASVNAGATAKYRLRIKNVGNVSLKNITVVDILPNTQPAPTVDRKVVNCGVSRNSQFRVQLPAALTPVMGETIEYSAQWDPCLSAIFGPLVNCGCPTNNPAWNPSFAGAGGSSGIYTLKIDFGPANILLPGQTLDYDFDVLVPAGTAANLTACNTFGAKAQLDNVTGLYTLPVENAAPACITSLKDSCKCDGSKWGDITLSNSNGTLQTLQCGGSYPAQLNQTININAFYNCVGTNCPGAVTYKLTPPSGSPVTGSAPVNFTTSLVGTYTLTLYGSCGGKICDSCQIIIKVNDTGCNCDGSKWGDLFYTGTVNGQQVLKQFKCNDNLNFDCNKPVNINAGYNCPNPAACPAKVSWSLTWPNATVQTGIAPLNFVPNQGGNYTVMLYGWCGNKICDSCRINIKVDCPPTDTCCKQNIIVKMKKPVTQQASVGGYNYTQASTSFSINGGGVLYQEVKLQVLSFNFSASNEECLWCKYKPFTWASVSAGNLAGIAPVTTGATPSTGYVVTSNLDANPREIVWSNGSAFNLGPPPVSFPAIFYLPPASALSCCELTARICVKLTFKDTECRICERIVCFDVPVKKQAVQPAATSPALEMQ